MRVVLDTNVLINGFDDDYSVQAKLINAVIEGELEAIVTAQVLREYSKLMRKLVRDVTYRERIEQYIAAAKEVQPSDVALQIDDEEDRKFLAAAVGGSATHVVTSDRHLLDVGEAGDVRVVTPQEAWVHWQDSLDDAASWRGWLEGIGITGST